MAKKAKKAKTKTKGRKARKAAPARKKKRAVAKKAAPKASAKKARKARRSAPRRAPAPAPAAEPSMGSMPPMGSSYVPGGGGSASTTFLASILRWPALSVPNGYVGPGLPVGLHIVGRAWQEQKIVNYAYAYEQATKYRIPPPTTPPLADSFASKFIGTWKLIAVRERDPSTGAETTAARRGIDGQLVYSPNGRLSVQIIREGREKAAAGSSDGFSSYFGTWKLLPAEGCVVHEQEWNINQAQSGQPAKRYYSFNDLGHLSLATPVRKRDSDGKDMQMVFVWSRIP